MPKKELLRKQLQKLKVDGLLITDLNNVRYMTGFTGSSGFAVMTGKKGIFVTDFRYEEQARQEVKGFSIKIEHTERTKEIKNICDVFGIRTLAFEDHNVTYDVYKKLIKRQIKLQPAEKIIELLRIIKSPQEMTFIRTAVKRAEGAFKKLLPHIKTGAEEQKLALRFEELLKSEGCKKLPFEVILASGPMSALPHAKPTSRKLKKGDLVVIDWGGECKGYFSDMTRTLLVKGADIARQKELYYNVLEAQKRAIESVKAGVRTSVIDDSARDCIEKQGYGDHFGHGTGHGVGLAVHERPVVSWRNKEVIKEHMVFTIEPGIYIPGFGGVRIEDMVTVRKDKAEVLTSLPKKLKIIER